MPRSRTSTSGGGDACFMIAKHVSGTWKRSFPASGGFEYGFD